MKNSADSSDIRLGRVLSLTAGTVIVSDGKAEYLCTLRGSLKKETTHEKNLVVVGDFVKFKPTDQHLPSSSLPQGVIESIEPRVSELARRDLLRHKRQLIAANVDQLILTVSILLPPLKPTLIDRYLIAAARGNMKPILVINKIDLFDSDEISEKEKEEERDLYLRCLTAYSNLGIPIVEASTVTKTGLDKLSLLLKDRSSLFSGQSGTGKSSLINLLIKQDLQKVGTIVHKTRKGSHTTTTSQLIPLECGGFCVDTPGIKSFGLWDVTREEIVDHFTEIKEIGKGCRFHNCSHLNEPGCKVEEAYQSHEISPLRFDSYKGLIESLKVEDKNR